MASPASSDAAHAPPRSIDDMIRQLPPKEELEASYRAAVAAAAGTLHDEVVEAQAADTLNALLLLRVCVAFIVRTFFQPDEFFQALEPAWQLVHGPASGAWLTWEWKQHLRTSLHPVLFAGLYATVELLLIPLHVVGPLRALVLVAAPGLLQACFTALTDYYTWRLAARLHGHGHNAAWTALALSVANPWLFFNTPRTFSNGLETTLTVAALCYWPWQLLGTAVSTDPRVVFAKGDIRRLRISLLLAATAVVLRPSNLLIWLALLTITLTRLSLDGAPSAAAAASPPGGAVVFRLLAESVGCGTVVLGLSVASDRLYYGAWTLPMYTFLDHNLTQDVAVFYGRSPWHYYLVQGVPLLTTTALPFVLYALVAALGRSASGRPNVPANAAAAAAPAVPAAQGAPDPVLTANARRALAFCVIAAITAFSLIAHKEVRFMAPLLPILLVLAAPHAASFFSSATTATPDQTTTLRHKNLLVAGLVFNALLALFLSLVHQAAPMGVVSFLRREYERIHVDWLEMSAADLPAYDVYPDSFLTLPERPAIIEADGDGDELFALFLLPCHSTPWRSHLVYPGLRARALTCEPPLGTAPGSAERAAYLDEADRFYASLTAAGASLAEQSRFLATELWPLVPENPDGKTAAAGSSAGSRRRGGELPRYIVGFEGIEDVLTHFFASDDPVTGGADLGVAVPLRRVWTSWKEVNGDWRRRGSLVVWDTGVYSNATHPDVARPMILSP